MGGMFGGLGDFFSKNSGWLEPLANLGTGVLGQVQKDNTQSQYLDYLKSQESNNYAHSVDDINAYNAQIAANNASSASRASAARATENNRMKASKKANKVSQQSYKDILAMYAPFRDAANTLLPQKMEAYQNSLGLQKSLLDYIKQPNQVAKLDAAGPAWNVNVPLPDSVRLK